MTWLADTGVATADQGGYTADGFLVVPFPPQPQPPPVFVRIPDSYNIYVNGVFNQNVPNPLLRLAFITGLHAASYDGVTVTQPTTYTIKVVAVSAGVEVAAYEAVFTAQPTSVTLTTPMKRILPFGSMALN